MAYYPIHTTYTITADPATAKCEAERQDRKQKRKGFELVKHTVEANEEGFETHVLEHSRPPLPPRPLTPKEQAVMEAFEKRFGKQE